MKQRLNLTVEADLIRVARQVAHERKTSVSALVEEYLRQLPARAPGGGAAFIARWAGRLSLAPLDGDPRRQYLWHKLDLDQPPLAIHESKPPDAGYTAGQQEPGCES